MNGDEEDSYVGCFDGYAEKEAGDLAKGPTGIQGLFGDEVDQGADEEP